MNKKLVVLLGQSNAYNAAAAFTQALPDHIIVNLAVKGTSIAEWDRGGKPYANCIGQLQRYIGRGFEIEWVFWMQGESDTFAGDEEAANGWRLSFYHFWAHFRIDLGLPIQLPFVVGQIGAETPGHPYWDVVKAQQAALPDGHPYIGVFTTDDLPYCYGVHFCEDGYDIVAQRAIEKKATL